jgi:hypothetical protein
VSEQRDRLERAHRLAGRGRSAETPLLAHVGVIVAVGVLVGTMLLVAFLLWFFLR